MSDDLLSLIEHGIVGRACSFVRREADWQVNLGELCSLSLECPWRIVGDGRIELGNGDDGQWFGLKAPLDGETEANRLLHGQHISEARVDRQTGDITLIFDSGRRLDAHNSSAGFEGWNGAFFLDGRGIVAVAMGGGEVALFDKGPNP